MQREEQRDTSSNSWVSTATIQTAASRNPGTGKPVKEGRVYFNRSTGVPPVAAHGQDAHATERGATGQYFEGVPPEVWNFRIGGYQVCEKWLKDRRGRTLTYEDLEHYRKVVTALSETIRLMAQIDAAIPKWPME